MAVADMYDALTSKRAYKEPISHDEAVKVMTDCAESSFDPQIFSTFLKISDDFSEVKKR
jgi:putative two-component system response regulator